MRRWCGWLLVFVSLDVPLYAASDLTQLKEQVQQLKAETQRMEKKLAYIQHQQHRHQIKAKSVHSPKHTSVNTAGKLTSSLTGIPDNFHSSRVSVHAPNRHPESLEFYPTALVADGEVLTYIAGTPVVTAPYLGARPSFDGSDYIVNISSINRDIRLMQQRRNLYRGFQQLGYPPPDVPIVAISGKVEPLAILGRSYVNQTTADIDLGSDELDVAAVLNDYVEAYMAIAYNAGYPANNGQRVANSGVNLNMGFVNIGNLDKSPYYFTAGQIFVPFGRYSTAMVSPTLPMLMFRTKARPFILGYKSQESTGPVVSFYGYTSDVTLGKSGVGGVNTAYIFELPTGSGEVGVGVMSSINDASGMQNTGSTPGTTFGGFASLTNGSEAVRKIPALDVHGNLSLDRFSITAEWAGVTARFRPQDLSYLGHGAKPQAAQVEAGVTFTSFNKPASIAVGYQWSKEALALNIPKERFNAVYNISIWKDTIESLEYRHDIDYETFQYANGANALNFAPNVNTFGTGRSADTVLIQLGVFF